jgi:hypothetical protein
MGLDAMWLIFICSMILISKFQKKKGMNFLFFCI